MAKILLLSNGHGEDLSGALIGKDLQKFDHQVEAFPFVGHGYSFSSAAIKIVGETKEFSTGGLGYTSLLGRSTEILQGQVFYLARRLFHLFSVAGNYDLLVVIGDVVPVLSAWLTRLPVVTYLVAYSSHYEGKLRLPWPCVNCLSSKRFLSVYSRDQLTADDLTNQLLRKVDFLGNPFMDPVLKTQPALPQIHSRLGLLPGSRRPELDKNLLLILRMIELLPEANVINNDISFDIALVPALDDESLRNLVDLQVWKLGKSIERVSCLHLIGKKYRVNIHRDSFVKVLQSSDILLSMAGTASEQAVGLGKPVLQLQGHGPQFTASFAEAQRRLLGPTVFCADGSVGEEINLRNTGRLLFDLLFRSKFDLSLQKECRQQALKRLGAEGGTRRIAHAISKLIGSF